MDYVKLSDVLTAQQLEHLQKVARESASNVSIHDSLQDALVPLMEQINEKTGQENDLAYWAYLVEFVFNR